MKRRLIFLVSFFVFLSFIGFAILVFNLNNEKLFFLLRLLPIKNLPKPSYCIQVITPAKNPLTGECKEFPTPCDVPPGWQKVEKCPIPSF
jgi:hypothetical protein